MLSIGAMKSGQQGYYLALAREDYYLNGGEPPGVWHGEGAADLGLVGAVDGVALTRLFGGFHPTEEGRALVQNAGAEDRQAGWDLTFSAPKSVSVLWSQADEATRRILQQAHFAAVQAGLDYLEDEVAVTRLGKGGQEREPARLVIATFEHHTSRAQDPQLHTHALVMNACTSGDGRTRTVESRPFYQAKMAAGAIYRAEYALQLENGLDLRIERKGTLFEVGGVSEPLVAEMSKRRAEIKESLAEGGYSGAEAAARATLLTRGTKGTLSQEELLREWQSVGREFGWGPEEAAQLIDAALPQTRLYPELERDQALEKAAERATDQQSYFSRREFTRYLAEESQGRGIGAGEVRTLRDTFLADREEIVALGRHKGELVYTTRAMMEEEKKLLAAVERSRGAGMPGVSETLITGVIATRKHFGEEQAKALRHITETGEGGSIRMVSGMAGTGKTTLLHAARMAWELEGYEVRGAALSGKAAEGLSEGAGIRSDTLMRTLLDLKHGRMSLHARSILVVDEAAMVGTRMMRDLVDRVEKTGARLVLVGDAQQLQPIEAGGPFAEMERRLASVQLTDIKRQREEWAREAVKDFAGGDAQKGLQAYAERGLVTIEGDRRNAMESLISAWKEKGIRNPEQQLILAGTRKEAAILNRLAQEERKSAGRIEGEGIAIPGTGDRLYAGDRVLFTKKSRLHGVENGSKGDVVDVDAAKGTLTARLDNGDRVHLSLNSYAEVRPGYAMTTHKGQGATTEWGFILAGGSMQDKEISYVQASRSRSETRIFTDVEEAGENLTRLVRQMNASRQKEMAHTVEQRNAREPRSAPEPRNAPEPDYSHDIGF